MKYMLFFLSALILSNCSGELVQQKNDQGQVIEEYTVNKDGLKDGIYKAYDDQGNLMEESQYKDGVLHGERKIFDKGVLYSIETRVKDEYEGPYKSYYENGQINMEGDYSDGAMNGPWKRYYPSGQLMEIVELVNNNENGPFVEYYENGNLKAEGNYKDGDNEHGLLKLYSEDGQLVKKMDCKEGICRTIWEAGKS